MNMNVRFGRILMLLAVVSTAAPVRAGASDRGGPEFGAPRNYAPATPAEKAAEARRLSQQAAALNQRRPVGRGKPQSSVERRVAKEGQRRHPDHALDLAAPPK